MVQSIFCYGDSVRMMQDWLRTYQMDRNGLGSQMHVCTVAAKLAWGQVATRAVPGLAEYDYQEASHSILRSLYSILTHKSNY